MKALGGYFELELTRPGSIWHTDCAELKSGRSSLNLILKTTRPKKILVPYYTCDALLEPILLNGTEYAFYPISQQLEISKLPKLRKDEYLIYINYFGLKDRYCLELSKQYNAQLIIDCTQSFFTKRIGDSWVFNSVRKFFGTPDGSFLYVPNVYRSLLTNSYKENDRFTLDHLLLRLRGEVEKGYESFKKNEVLNSSEIRRMSTITRRLLENIDWQSIIATRRSNFQYYHELFSKNNLLQIDQESGSVPFYYPLLTESQINRKLFFDERIYIPTFWNDCISRKGDPSLFINAITLTKNLLLLPIDHRYNHQDLSRVIQIAKKEL